MCFPRLFDLLLLQLDCLIVHEHALALVRVRSAPVSDLGSKRHDLFPVDALDEDSRRLGCGDRDAKGNTHLDGVGVAQLEEDELLSGVFLLCGAGVDRGSVTNAD